MLLRERASVMRLAQRVERLLMGLLLSFIETLHPGSTLEFEGGTVYS
jgi:hypothetical protein